MSPNCDFESILSEYKNHSQLSIPVFFCRYVFTGTSLIEVNEQFQPNPMKISSTNGNSTLNGFISLNEKTSVENMSPIKSRYMNLWILFDFFTNYKVLILSL